MTKQDKDIALRVTKQFYKDVLKTGIPRKTFSRFLEQSIVAGGAIRDTIFDKEVADVDIFMPKGNKHPDVSEWSLSFWQGLGFECISKEEYDTENGFRVMENKDKYDLPVQLIFSRYASSQEIIKSFPVSISRVYWSPKDNKIHKSATFREHELNGRVYFTRGGKHVPYVTKIYNKYPETHGKWKGVD